MANLRNEPTPHFMLLWYKVMIQQGLAQATFSLMQTVQLRSEDEDMGRLISVNKVFLMFSSDVHFFQLLVVDRSVT